MSVEGRGGRRKKKNEGIAPRLSVWGWYRFIPSTGLSRVPHQLSPPSLFPVRRALPSTLSLDSSSSQRRPAGLSLGPGCHARGHRRFLREVVPAAGAGQSSPLVTTLPADDTSGERAVPQKAGHPDSFFVLTTEQTILRGREILVFFPLFSPSCSRIIPFNSFYSVKWNEIFYFCDPNHVGWERPAETAIGTFHKYLHELTTFQFSLLKTGTQN